MSNDQHERRTPETRFWRSPVGYVLMCFLAVTGILLAFEHRAHILSGDGFLVALLVACVVMHLFMHGGHGGHSDK